MTTNTNTNNSTSAEIWSRLSAHAQLRRTTIMTNAAKFGLGNVVATPGALDLLQKHGFSAAQLLARHVTGDWGDVCAEDRGLNEQALTTGSRLMSVYRLTNPKVLATMPRKKRSDLPTIWIISESEGADGRRASTCVLLPESY